MAKFCHKCKTKNPDDSFWCINCDTKLTDGITIEVEEPKIEQPLKNQTDVPKILDKMPRCNHQSSVFSTRATVFKTVLILLIIILVISISYFLYQNFYGVGKFGEDYWFEGDKLYTENGWVFTITERSDCNFDGIVLGINRYNKNPFSNDPTIIFSPIDIFCGFDDVAENLDNYPYEVTMWRDRVVWSSCGGSRETSEYFHSHNTNTHIIPHNKEVSEALLTIKDKDMIIINGTYVSLHGINEEKSLYGYRWTTDTTPGNHKCELILVDTLVINGANYSI